MEINFSVELIFEIKVKVRIIGVKLFMCSEPPPCGLQSKIRSNVMSFIFIKNVN